MTDTRQTAARSDRPHEVTDTRQTERAGFDLGRKYQVEVREGKLTIWAEPALEA